MNLSSKRCKGVGCYSLPFSRLRLRVPAGLTNLRSPGDQQSQQSQQSRASAQRSHLGGANPLSRTRVESDLACLAPLGDLSSNLLVLRACAGSRAGNLARVGSKRELGVPRGTRGQGRQGIYTGYTFHTHV